MAACDPFSEAEMVEMLQSRAMRSRCAKRNQALFALECCTGGRISEILRLTRGDVMDERGDLRDKVTFTRTKNKHPRTVSIVNEFLRPYLSSWLHFQRYQLGYCLAEDPLFPVMGGRCQISRTGVWRIYKNAARELGLRQRVGTHSCRKTWAKATYEYYNARRAAGENIDPLMKTKEAGGWLNLESVSRYLNFMLGDTSDSQAAIFKGLKQATKSANMKG